MWTLPPSPPRSGPRSAALVVGIVAAVVLLLGGFLVAGVTLGYRDAAGHGRSAGPAGTDATAQHSASAVDRDLAGEEWVSGGGHALGSGAILGSCWPEGWGTGVTSRYKRDFRHHDPAGQTDGLAFVTISNYDTIAHSGDDIDRAQFTTWRDCDATRLRSAYPGSTVTVERAPTDPFAPGVGYVETIDDREDDVFVVRVEQQIAIVRFCSCTRLGTDGKQAMAARVAGVLAAEQGLPAPGSREGG